MCAQKVCSLYGELSLEDKGFKQGLADAKGGMSGLQGQLQSMAVDWIAAGGLLKGFEAGLGYIVNAAADGEVAETRLNAIVEATGYAAGIGADQLIRMSESEAQLTGTSHDLIQNAESILLTFKEIGRDIFPEVVQGALDLSATFGMDLQSAATMLGKAMEDPILGMTTLRRTGIFLSDEQQLQVKDFMAVNDIASAQGVILEVLKGKLGGVSDAMGDTYKGRVNKLNDSFDQIAETLGGPVIGGVGAAADGFNGLLQALIHLNDEAPKTEAEWDYWIGLVNKSTSIHEEAAGAIGGMRDKLWNSVLAMKAADGAADGLSTSIADIPKVADEATRAMSGLAWEIGGSLTQENKNFTDSQGDLQASLNDTLAQITDLNGREYLTGDQKGQLADLYAKYGDLQVQYNDNATEHEKATKRILLDLLEQSMALQGLNDPALFTQMAEDWGLITKAEADAYDNASFATNYLKDHPGDVATAENIMGGMGLDWRNLGVSISDTNGLISAYYGWLQLLDGKTIDTYINEHRTTTGQGGNTITEIRAGGVDTWYSQPTLIEVGEAGLEHVQVTPASGTGKSGGGSITNYITVYGGADPLATYQAVVGALDAATRANERAGINYSDL